MRNVTQPIRTLLDCSKAFDMVKYDILFTKLLDKGLPAVVVRTIIFVYEKQFAWVRWGRARSEMFSIVNGTRQGSVLSPALFSIYMDKGRCKGGPTFCRFYSFFAFFSTIYNKNLKKIYIYK